MRLSLRSCGSCAAWSSLIGMGLAAVLFFISGVSFLVMMAWAFLSLFGLIFVFSVPALGLVLLTVAGFCLAAYNVVRSVELIDMPDARGLGFLAGRTLPLAALLLWAGAGRWWM